MNANKSRVRMTVILAAAVVVCIVPRTLLVAQEDDTDSTSRDVALRIADVESSLTAPVMIEGAEQVFHSLAEQMEFHSVPGVSIAVINEGKIEWAKGYGIRDAGANLPVDENTIFQAASLSKP